MGHSGPTAHTGTLGAGSVLLKREPAEWQDGAHRPGAGSAKLDQTNHAGQCAQRRRRRLQTSQTRKVRKRSAHGAKAWSCECMSREASWRKVATRSDGSDASQQTSKQTNETTNDAHVRTHPSRRARGLRAVLPLQLARRLCVEPARSAWRICGGARPRSRRNPHGAPAMPAGSRALTDDAWMPVHSVAATL